jgi:hypothetical protein
MREKLNENPLAQVGLVLVLVVVAAVMFIGSSGGGEEEETAPTEATVAVAGTSAIGTAAAATPGEAVEGAVESALEVASEEGAAPAVASAVPTPPPPAPVTAAYDSGKTVVLLIVHDGGIDDALVERSSALLAAMPEVALFTVPATQIARYAAITVGLDVNRVPALVVMRPKRLSNGTPQASVDYGFQTPQGIAQAVQDASYHGREVTYHPN